MAGPAPVSPPQARKLPPLRRNLQFVRGAPTPEGVPTWTIVDPVRNKYFQIEASTSSARIDRATRQPMIRRANTSITNAT